MDHPRYATDVSLAYDYYEFISVGKKGSILKCIVFYQDPDNHSVYVCVLGDVMDNGNISVNVVTDNGDMPLVLATVVEAATSFLKQYPDCYISIKGSNKSRTRLYRMAINVNFDVLSKDFDISGVFETADVTESFIKGTVKDYDSFLVKLNK